jgi:phosphoribosylformimino-5-aminoimidazole carboxamide ribotide isomerase
MIVIPAIDVLDGRCVRLVQGDYAQATVYGDDPADVAQRFIAAGARRIHVVDLDAARGRPTRASASAIAGVVRACAGVGCDVQVGGGVRDVTSALSWLNAGASFVVCGSIAIKDTELAHAVCEAAGGRVLLALDVRDGIARAEGWTEEGIPATDLLRTWSGWGAAGVVYTDTARDGLMTGPDLDGLGRYRMLYGGPVLLSGGISSLDDIAACVQHDVDGVVIGKALYEGRFDLAAALRAVVEPA